MNLHKTTVKKRCESHKPSKFENNYLKRHDWAMDKLKKGIKQKQCLKCKRWFFPSEY